MESLVTLLVVLVVVGAFGFFIYKRVTAPKSGGTGFGSGGGKGDRPNVQQK